MTGSTTAAGSGAARRGLCCGRSGSPARRRGLGCKGCPAAALRPLDLGAGHRGHGVRGPNRSRHLVRACSVEIKRNRRAQNHRQAAFVFDQHLRRVSAPVDRAYGDLRTRTRGCRGPSIEQQCQRVARLERRLDGRAEGDCPGTAAYRSFVRRIGDGQRVITAELCFGLRGRLCRDAGSCCWHRIPLIVDDPRLVSAC